MVGSDKRRRSIRKLITAFVVVFLLLGAGVFTLRSWYTNNLKPVSSSSQTAYFTVEPGSTVHQIAVKLKSQSLIRSSQAFETYVRGHADYGDLQAGTYVLSPSMDVKSIVTKLTSGDVAKNLLTILPAKRLDEIKKSFFDAKYSKQEVDAAFNASKYRDHPVLLSLPANATLEGYLYPDSFQKQTDTPAQVIVRQSLDEMQKHLTADILNGFTAQGLTVYEGITLASMVLKETDDPQYQPTVAQVFLLRKSKNIALESDPTAHYAADIAGVPRSLQIDSPYNTYKYPGLPPGPISNTTESALKAVANPGKTDYLFFVSGDDGKNYFSKTIEEHQKLVEQHCKKKCGR